jgi:hypothetical protein
MLLLSARRGAAEGGSLAAIVLSASVFAGSAQFTAIAILSQGGTIAAAIGAAALINSRQRSPPPFPALRGQCTEGERPGGVAAAGGRTRPRETNVHGVRLGPYTMDVRRRPARALIGA